MTDSYWDLFIHRSDVFAEQHSDGHYEPVRCPITAADVADHLAGRRSYGVYVIDPASYAVGEPGGIAQYVPPNTVKYIVFDLDTYSLEALRFLTTAVEGLVKAPWQSFKCLLCEDSGGKGYHIWLLLASPVAAARARAWGETIRALYDAHRAIANSDWPALEVFPKQDAVPEGGYGNLVKLPLGRHAKSGAMSYFMHRPGWATGIDDVQPLPEACVPALSPGSKPAVTSHDEATGATAFACINELLEQGAPSGCRDKAMYFLARFWRTSGLTESQCEAVCLDANEKFDPPMSASQVRKCVRSAYVAEFARPKCGEDWHGSFCPGSDRMRACPNFHGDATAVPADDYDFGESLQDIAKRLRGES
jgi:hypothetical protein